jgi:hypothetical protein
VNRQQGDRGDRRGIDDREIGEIGEEDDKEIREIGEE